MFWVYPDGFIYFDLWSLWVQLRKEPINKSWHFWAPPFLHSFSALASDVLMSWPRPEGLPWTVLCHYSDTHFDFIIMVSNTKDNCTPFFIIIATSSLIYSVYIKSLPNARHYFLGSWDTSLYKIELKNKSLPLGNLYSCRRRKTIH